MTDLEKLREIKEREAKATKGPWEWGLGYGDRLELRGKPYRDNLSCVLVCERHRSPFAADANLIVESREDILWLIREVERLHALSETYKQQAEEFQRMGEGWFRQLQTARKDALEEAGQAIAKAIRNLSGEGKDD